jgi:MYXO-CTERM domain-containing protein
MKLPILVFSLWIAAVEVASTQSTIISVAGALPPNLNLQYSPTLSTNGYPVGVSWSMASAFNNVQISLGLGGNPSAVGLAYLTTQIGLGTTSAFEIVSSTFLFPTTNSMVSIFSGLNLQAGTYYLTVQGVSNGQNGNCIWAGLPTPIINTANGVTTNGQYWNYYAPYNLGPQGYSPATQFSTGPRSFSLFQVTGFEVPEPSTWAMASLGLLLLAGRRRRL